MGKVSFHIFFHPQERATLLFWLKLLEDEISATIPRSFHQDAQPPTHAVASMVGSPAHAKCPLELPIRFSDNIHVGADMALCLVEN